MYSFLLMFVLVGLVACGVKSKTDANSAASSEDSSSLGSYTTCRDDLRLNDVPAGWLEVTAAELVTGKKEYFQITKVKSLFKTVFEGHPLTVVSEAEFEDGDTQRHEVTCENLLGGEFLSFNVPVPMHISKKDGSLYRSDRREASLIKLNYDLKNGDRKNASASRTDIKSPMSQGLKSESPLIFLNSGEKTVKFYSLPDGQLEVRKSEIVKVNGKSAEFSTKFRYRLIK